MCVCVCTLKMDSRLSEEKSFLRMVTNRLVTASMAASKNLLDSS